VFIRHLELTDFRSHETLRLDLGDGLCVIVGENGRGKTNIVEAISILATGSSFRGAPVDAMVRVGAQQAIVRAGFSREGRDQLVEAELSSRGRSRYLVNRQKVARTSDLAEGIMIVVFSPDDLELVKGGPGGRRAFLDEVIVGLHPRNARLRSDVEKILKQRNSLLKQSGGRLDSDAEATLDVWDQRLAEAGTALARAREDAVVRLEPELVRAVTELDHGGSGMFLSYRRSWEGELGGALAAARPDELRRGLTLVGPQRDDLDIGLDAMPARTHASQGQQRTLALGLRLGSQAIISAERRVSPVLILDDVLSELDPGRSAALLESLPEGQCVLTSAQGVPAGVEPERLIDLDAVIATREPFESESASSESGSNELASSESGSNELASSESSQSGVLSAEEPIR